MTRSHVLLLVLLSACGRPAFTSSMRSNGFEPTARVETVCRYFEDPYNRELLDVYSQAVSESGFRLVYVSHYTSDKTLDFHSVFCFERAREAGEPSNHHSITRDRPTPWRTYLAPN